MQRCISLSPYLAYGFDYPRNRNQHLKQRFSQVVDEVQRHQASFAKSASNPTHLRKDDDEAQKNESRGSYYDFGRHQKASGHNAREEQKAATRFPFDEITSADGVKRVSMVTKSTFVEPPTKSTPTHLTDSGARVHNDSIIVGSKQLLHKQVVLAKVQVQVAEAFVSKVEGFGEAKVLDRTAVRLTEDGSGNVEKRGEHTGGADHLISQTFTRLDTAVTDHDLALLEAASHQRQPTRRSRVGVGSGNNDIGVTSSLDTDIYSHFVTNGKQGVLFDARDAEARRTLGKSLERLPKVVIVTDIDNDDFEQRVVLSEEKRKGIVDPKVVVAHNDDHGNTFATGSVGGADLERGQAAEKP